MAVKYKLAVILFLTFFPFWFPNVWGGILPHPDSCQALLQRWISPAATPDEYLKKQNALFWSRYQQPGWVRWRTIMNRWRELRRDFYMWLNENPRPALYYSSNSPCFPKIVLYVDALKDGTLASEPLRAVRTELENWISDFQNYQQDLNQLLDELNASDFHYQALKMIKQNTHQFPMNVNYTIPIKGVPKNYRDEVDNTAELNDHLWQLKKRIKALTGNYFGSEIGAISSRIQFQALLTKRLKYLRAAMRDIYLNNEELPPAFNQQYQLIDRLLNATPSLQPHYTASTTLLKKELTMEFQELSRLKTQWYKDVVDPNVQKVLALLTDGQKERMGFDKFGRYKNILLMTKYSFIVTKITPILAGTPMSFWALHDLVRLFNWNNDEKEKCVRTQIEPFEKCVANYLQATHLELLTKVDGEPISKEILQDLTEMVIARARFLEEKKKEGQLERDLMDAVRKATSDNSTFKLSTTQAKDTDGQQQSTPLKKSFLFWQW